MSTTAEESAGVSSQTPPSGGPMPHDTTDSLTPSAAGEGDESTTFPPFEIIYQNEEMFVVNKPPNVPMDGDGPHTVEKWALAQHEFLRRPLGAGLRSEYSNGHKGPSTKQLKFVHQLDAATSGLLCLAFSRDMAARLAHCFELRYTKKIYSAVLLGHVPAALLTASDRLVTLERPQSSTHQPRRLEEGDALEKGTTAPADTTIGTEQQLSQRVPNIMDSSGGPASASCATAAPTTNLSVAAASSPTSSAVTLSWSVGGDPTDESGFRMTTSADSTKARAAETLLQVEAYGYIGNTPVTKVLLRPMTGRRHQLRVHCLRLGHPIVGDPTYAPETRSVAPRLLLHALELTLYDRIDICDETKRNRVEDKKKRRRETLGLVQRDLQQQQSNEDAFTVCTADPFTALVASAPTPSPASKD